MESDKTNNQQNDSAVTKEFSFSELLEKEPITSLPYSEAEYFINSKTKDKWMGIDDIEVYSAYHDYYSHLDTTLNTNLNILQNTGISIFDTFAYEFPINNFEPFSVNNLFFYKRLPPISKDIEFLLYHSKVFEIGMGCLIIGVTYDKKLNKIIDHKVLFITGDGLDADFHSGFKIDKHYNIRIASVIREDYLFTINRELVVEKNGLIRVEKVEKYRDKKIETHEW